jgi:hypothetical protein
MRTYIPDQWLRYTNSAQLVHRSPEDFANDLITA